MTAGCCFPRWGCMRWGRTRKFDYYQFDLNWLTGCSNNPLTETAKMEQVLRKIHQAFFISPIFCSTFAAFSVASIRLSEVNKQAAL